MCNVSIACAIAGVPTERVHLVDHVEALCAAYNRKLNALRPADKATVQNQHIMFAEMGHTQSSIIVVKVHSNDSGDAEDRVEPVTIQCSDTLGAMSFDLCIFHHFSAVIEKKYGEKVKPGTKRGFRLLAGCERIRKLLSQLGEAQITVENLTDGGDVNFNLTREEMASICAEPLREFKSLVQDALDNVTDGEGNPVSLDTVEILGGGMRMQVAQNALLEVIGGALHMGAKFDDGSAALGGAIVTKKRYSMTNAEELKHTSEVTSEESPADEQPTSDSEKPPYNDASNFFVVHGAVDLTVSPFVEKVSAAREKELEMQRKDAEVRQMQAERNAMESYMYEMKSAVGRKHGQLIDSAVLSQKMEEYDNWLWDNPPDNTSLEALKTQFSKMKEEMSDVMASYNTKVAEEKAVFEKQLEEEAKKAAAEKELEGEDEDHDNRKLKKADRMRMVLKNKEEGTELFKGKNFRPAAARYHKALTHASKFFDLSPDDEVEVSQVKLSLYLNLSQCYIKLENWDNTLRNVEEALKIDSSNSKALFRRSVAWEAKKEYDKALEDLKRAQAVYPDDTMIQKATERILKLISKEKAKEKKMWGRAFGGTEAAAPSSSDPASSDVSPAQI